MTEEPRSRRLGSRGPVQRFRQDQQREAVGPLSAGPFPDPQGNRLHRLPGAHALRAVYAEHHCGFDQRHHGTGKPGLPAGQAGHHASCDVHRPDLLDAGTGLTGGNSQLTPETSQNFDFGVVVAADPQHGHHAGLLPDPAQEHHRKLPAVGDVRQSERVHEVLRSEHCRTVVHAHAVGRFGHELHSLTRRRPADTSF